MSKQKKRTSKAGTKPAQSKKVRRRPAVPVKLRRLLGLMVAVLGFLIYANTLGHQYALDDHSVIKENYIIKGGLKNVPTILTTNYRYGYWNSKGALYRPIPLILYAAEWQLSPDNPTLYHLVNVLLYALTGFVLFMLLSRIMSGWHVLIPLLTSLFFMAHPVHTEVVANIKSRDEILAFLFCLGAIHFLWNYLKTNKLGAIVAALGMYALALFSKESVITFLAVFPLLIYFFTKKSWAENLKTVALFAIPAVLYFVIRASVLGDMSAGTGEASVLDNVLRGSEYWIVQKATAFLLMGKYLLSLLFPHPLGSDFGYNQIPLTNWADWKVILSLLVHGGLLVVALRQFKAKRLLSLGILLYFITFSIFSNVLVMIGSSFGERFLYIPSLGFSLMLAVVLMKIFDMPMAKVSLPDWSALLKIKPALLAVAGLLIALYAAKTVSRNPAWYNSYSLYATDVLTAPNSAKLNYHYGLETMKEALNLPDAQKRQQIGDAITAFEKALQIYPNYHDVYAQRGLAYFRLNQPDKALADYQKSLELKPNNAKVYSNMGIIYFQKNNLPKAREVYEKAVELDPRFVDARRNLGAVYAGMKQYDKAIQQWEEGLKYAPNNATLIYYIGTAYRDKGEAQKAAPYLQRAAALDPNLKQ